MTPVDFYLKSDFLKIISPLYDKNTIAIKIPSYLIKHEKTKYVEVITKFEKLSTLVLFSSSQLYKLLYCKHIYDLWQCNYWHVQKQ